MSVRRLSLNYHIFCQSPVAAIKQILGPNVSLLSYKVNSVISWSGEVFVDVEYTSIPIDQFSIYYIPINNIKHLIPNSEKYIFTLNGCQVKLTNPRLNQFNNYLPVRIKRSIINDTDAYDNYYSSIDDTSSYSLKTGLTNSPAQYFATTVINPMNSLLTPLPLVSTNSINSINSTNEMDEMNSLNNFGLGFSINMPDKLYPSTFNPKIDYTMETTIQHYKQLLTNCHLLSLADDIKVFDSSTDGKIFSASNLTSRTCYLIKSSELPNHSIHGIIALQPKRIPDILLFYPTNKYNISVDELNSIKQFIMMDTINYYNYLYIKQ